MDRTYLVECYWPGDAKAARTEAVARASDAARVLRAEGCDIRFLDGLFLPADEVAFYRFAGQAAADVAQACTRAQLPFERVSEYVAVPDAPPHP